MERIPKFLTLIAAYEEVNEVDILSILQDQTKQQMTIADKITKHLELEESLLKVADAILVMPTQYVDDLQDHFDVMLKSYTDLTEQLEQYAVTTQKVLDFEECLGLRDTKLQD